MKIINIMCTLQDFLLKVSKLFLMKLKTYVERSISGFQDISGKRKYCTSILCNYVLTCIGGSAKRQALGTNANLSSLAVRKVIRVSKREGKNVVRKGIESR